MTTHITTAGVVSVQGRCNVQGTRCLTSMAPILITAVFVGEKLQEVYIVRDV